MYQSKADRETIAEMQDLLALECRKPANKRDYDMIEQLTAAIYEATSEANLSEITARNIEKLAAISAKKTGSVRKMRLIRRSAALAACAVLCIGLHAWTMSAFGMGLPAAIYQVTKGGISFRMNDLEATPIHLPASTEDPYGIRTECGKHGFLPLTPTYLPDDLILTVLDTHDAAMTNVNFHYRDRQDEKKTVSLDYTYIADKQIYENFDWGFPTEQYHVNTETINGKNVLISWEDTVFHAAFCDPECRIVYHISSNNIGYEETYQILCSYFT